MLSSLSALNINGKCSARALRSMKHAFWSCEFNVSFWRLFRSREKHCSSMVGTRGSISSLRTWTTDDRAIRAMIETRELSDPMPSLLRITSVADITTEASFLPNLVAMRSIHAIALCFCVSSTACLTTSAAFGMKARRASIDSASDCLVVLHWAVMDDITTSRI